MNELGIKRRMPLVALALLACEQLKIPIGYGALPSDSAPSGGWTTSGGAVSSGGASTDTDARGGTTAAGGPELGGTASAQGGMSRGGAPTAGGMVGTTLTDGVGPGAGGTVAGNGGANDGGTSQGGSSGIGGQGGEVELPAGAGGGPNTAPALWLASMRIQVLCEGPSAIGALDDFRSVGRWSPAEGVVPLVEPPSVLEAANITGWVPNADCSVVATTFLGPDRSSNSALVVRWSGSEPGTILSVSPLSPLNLAIPNADLSVIASSITEDTGSGPTSRVVVWKAGVVTELDPPAGFKSMLPDALNADGSVLFGVITNQPILDRAETATFRWTEATGAVALPELRGCGVSAHSPDSSRVFGWCGEGQVSAFGWRVDTGVFALGEPSTTIWIQPEYSSVDGSTVTGAYDGYPGGLFVWREDRGFELVASSGGTETRSFGFALGMSTDGRVIVATLSHDATYRLVRWSASAGVSELEVPPTGRCDLSSLSKDGRIVAGQCWPEDFSQQFAVIWDSDGKIQRVDELLRTAGVDLKGAQLVSAKVDASGRFVGGYTNEDHQSYVARLP